MCTRHVHYVAHTVYATQCTWRIQIKYARAHAATCVHAMYISVYKLNMRAHTQQHVYTPCTLCCTHCVCNVMYMASTYYVALTVYVTQCTWRIQIKYARAYAATCVYAMYIMLHTLCM